MAESLIIMAKKKKILVFAQSNVGGAERVAVTITKGLDDKKFDVIYYLVGMTNDRNFPLEDFIPNHWTVHRINKMHSMFLMLMLLWTLLKESPDIVFSSTLYLNGKLLVFRSLFQSTRFIIRCENYLYTFKEKQRERIKKLYKKASLIIAQTEEMKEELLANVNVPNDIVSVIHNPLDKQTIDRKIKEGSSPYAYDNEIRFCASGRFTYQKGFDMLVKAFAIVKRQIPNSQLYIVGKNDGQNSMYYDEIVSLAKEYGVFESVYCVGFTNNPYVYVKNSNCFVLSSRWEGLPNVLIEALYLGTPVAAYKCIPIIERIVKENVDGFLAEKEDVDSLAQAMLKACKLGRIVPSYKPSEINDFHRIFE